MNRNLGGAQHRKWLGKSLALERVWPGSALHPPEGKELTPANHVINGDRIGLRRRELNPRHADYDSKVFPIYCFQSMTYGACICRS